MPLLPNEESPALQDVVRVLIALSGGNLGVDDRAYRVSAAGLDSRDWLARLEPEEVDAVHGESVHIARAGIAVALGDFAGAHAEVARIADPADRDATALWLALREGAELPAVETRHRNLGPAVSLRRGQMPRERIEFANPDSCEPDFRAAVATAITGDGGPLAAVLGDCLVGYMPELLLGILPRVTTHRAALIDSLRLYRENHWLAFVEPYELIYDLAMVRDLARVAGDADRAAYLQTIIARHATVLADRDRALAFALLKPDLVVKDRPRSSRPTTVPPSR